MSIELTGRWMGRYDYGAGSEAVPFEAEIVQEASGLMAETVEPNTFRPGGPAELRGRLTGWVVEGEVRLTKTYDFDQGGDPEYVGRVDPAGRRITGRWSFPGLPDIGGGFVIVRKPRAMAETKESAAAEA